MDEKEMQRCFESAVELAKKGGELIRAAFDKPKRVDCKGGYSTDLVTETDEEVEKMILMTLRERFPTHAFIGEESVAAGEPCTLTDDPTWLIDPVDGTTNFVHRFPFVAVSIGLFIKKEPVIGIVYNAPQDLMYTARKGMGAQCNGREIHVSEQTELCQALVICEVGGTREPERMEVVRDNSYAIAMPPDPAHSVRAVGSAAINMCLVASGCADAYQEYGIHCWDIAAGSLIVTEAGGVVMDPKGGSIDVMRRKLLCASSPQLAQQISSCLKDIDLPHD
ncbi:inositol monophosphatase 1-like [Corticium candelabrum]|uniref:inositol monophosphatase 1-like n=1 Tax=Corticium candelabrum TaxID=121492 RepID=UPI002E258E4F|nr:inositol monophosphatase 1-like [Corticium candelabrum]